MDGTSSEGELSFNLNLDPSAQISTQQLPDDTTTTVADEQFKNQEGQGQGGNRSMMEVISRIERESRRMTQMVADMLDKCSVTHHQLVDLIRKRKAAERIYMANDDNHEHDHDHDPSCCKRIRMISCKPKITTTFIRVDPSDASLVVKDGYQWRKYGQKVTRDNPSPRAYFKCSFAPICPVKKKVQKSAEDPTVVVATYEGEHNHKQQQPSTNTNTNTIHSISSSFINPSPSTHISSPSSSSSLSLSLKERGSGIITEEDHDVDEDRVRRPLEQWLLHQMASSLTQDPSFTSTLAAAISDQVIYYNKRDSL